MDLATLRGSAGSKGAGTPVFVAQNLQDRVHISPRIIKVAVPRPQQSAMLGQRPLVQMVCSLCRFTISLPVHTPYRQVSLFQPFRLTNGMIIHFK